MAGTPASGIPARGRYVPFGAANLAHLGSGARSTRIYGPLASELAAGLLTDREDLSAYPEAVAAWSQSEAQCLLMRRHLEEVGTFDDDGKPREALLKWLATFERLAAGHRQLLGLDPRSEASLARDRASAAVLSVDLAAIAERGREALRKRQIDEVGNDIAGTVLAREMAAYGSERAVAAQAFRES